MITADMVIRGLTGGVLIGLGASVLLLLSGRVAAITGIVAGLAERTAPNWMSNVVFVAGLLSGGLVLSVFFPAVFADSPRPMLAVAAAGLLVGYGSRLGNGCTSGHGVCGISRGSPRSIVATMTFVLVGAVAAIAAGRLMGGT